MPAPLAHPTNNRANAIASSSVLRILVCAALFTAFAVVESSRLTSLNDIEIWLHLQTGIWILQNHSLPHTLLFSQASGMPWAVPDWGFDVILGVLYKMLGLRAIPVMMMIAKSLIALALFLLANPNRDRFWTGVVISAFAQFALIDLPSRPLAYGVVLFAFELLILLGVRRTGETRPLLFLPALFLLWANVDWHCYIGLLSLLLFLAVVTAEKLRFGVPGAPKEGSPSVSLGRLGLITLASAIATLLPPYSYHVFEVAYGKSFSGLAVGHFPDMRAIPFRHPQDYVAILLTMSAFFFLGRQRSRDVFKFALLAICAFLGFRFQRETWMIIVAAVGIMGDALPITGETITRHERPGLPHLVTALCALIVLVAAASRIPPQDKLLDRAAETLPVRASEFIRSNRLPGPLFNSIEWGGFLTWELPDYPVAMDTRVDAYADRAERYFAVTQGEMPLDTDSSFMDAQTVLLDKNSMLAKALVKFPNFRLAYQDDLAVVLVKQ